MPATEPLPAADLYVGTTKHLDTTPLGSTSLVLGPNGVDLATALERIAEVIAAGQRACVLAAGDPGFFGVGRALAERFGPNALEVRPAPAPVSLAFGRLGLPWDDAVVVSAQGQERQRNEALIAARTAAARDRKAAVLTSPDTPPERVGQALLEAGAPGQMTVAVCCRLGMPREQVAFTDLAGLAAGSWDPYSIVVLLPAPVPDSHVSASVHWSGGARPWLGGARFGRDASAFQGRSGMGACPEARAVVLAKLELPRDGILWDVGAGGASVAIEAALLAPALEIHAIERDPRVATQARANASRHGVSIKVHNVHAPDGLSALPRPDRIFVSGGAIDVLDGCLAYLKPGGRVVVAFTLLDRLVPAVRQLGSLLQLTVATGRRLPGRGWGFTGTDPLFVAWGPGPAAGDRSPPP